MRVFTNGRVTIPKAIREKLGIAEGSNVDFRLEQGRYYLHNMANEKGLDINKIKPSLPEVTPQT